MLLHEVDVVVHQYGRVEGPRVADIAAGPAGCPLDLEAEEHALVCEGPDLPQDGRRPTWVPSKEGVHAVKVAVTCHVGLPHAKLLCWRP